MTERGRFPDTGRMLVGVTALGLLALLLASLVVAVPALEPAARALLVVAPVAGLGVALVRGRPAGALPGALLAIVVAVVAGADTLTLGVLGGVLLLALGLLGDDSGFRAGRRALAVAGATGAGLGVSAGVIASVTAAGPAPAPVVLVVALLLVVAVAFAVRRGGGRLGSPQGEDSINAGPS
jgi:hypothetical protein